MTFVQITYIYRFIIFPNLLIQPTKIIHRYLLFLQFQLIRLSSNIIYLISIIKDLAINQKDCTSMDSNLVTHTLIRQRRHNPWDKVEIIPLQPMNNNAMSDISIAIRFNTFLTHTQNIYVALKN